MKAVRVRNPSCRHSKSRRLLRRRGHEVELAPQTVAHGGGQAIYRLDDGYFGASDLRRDGQAVGF